NVRGTYLMSRAVLPSMIERRAGAIVNIGSAAGLRGSKALAAYSASKGAIIGLTRAMAVDHGPSGIRVNCVCPGPTQTAHFKRNMAALPNGREIVAAQLSALPLGRLGEPDDIARSIVYLASDEASWITGAIVSVDGGTTAR